MDKDVFKRRCGACGGVVSTDAEFCPHYDTILPPNLCQSCLEELPVGASFCTHCGLDFSTGRRIKTSVERTDRKLLAPDSWVNKRYNIIVVICGAVAGFLGILIFCPPLLVNAYLHGLAPQGVSGFKLFQGFFGGAGLGGVFGTSLACLFAPPGFFATKMGRRMLGWVGVDNTVLARVACGIFAIIPLVFGWLILSGNMFASAMANGIFCIFAIIGFALFCSMLFGKK